MTAKMKRRDFIALLSGAAIARSISLASRTLIGLNSTPTDDAAVWTAPNTPIPAKSVGSRMTAARVTLGAISLSSSSHLPPKLYSNEVNPVTLPLGRARLSTIPAPTGSATSTNTIGTLRVACSNGATAAAPLVRMTSGERATNSEAYLRASAALPALQRKSIRKLRPSIQPNCCSRCLNAAMRACCSGSSAA